MCVKHAPLCFYCLILYRYRGILCARAVLAARTLATFAARKLLATLVGQPDRYAAGESRREHESWKRGKSLSRLTARRCTVELDAYRVTQSASARLKPTAFCRAPKHENCTSCRHKNASFGGYTKNTALERQSTV